MKNLYKSNEYKVFGGVAGGIGEYLDIDPIIIRSLFLVGFLVFGSGILVYLILWIFIPRNPITYYPGVNESSSENNSFNEINNHPFTNLRIKENQNRRIIFGGLLIFLGIMILISNILPNFDEKFIIPLLMIAFGSLLIFAKFTNKLNGVHFENK